MTVRAHRRERLRQEHAAQVHREDPAPRRRHASASRARSPRCSSSAPASTRSCRAARTCTSTARSSGCRRKQLDRRFDDIVGFAGLEQFIDTPVKNYSSGMYVRLGFSVAINVDPDILLVDEVLAVGDEEFQRRCAEKFAELKHRGRRSSSCRTRWRRCAPSATRSCCSSTASSAATGPAGDVIDEYLADMHEDREAPTSDGGSRWGSGEGRIEDVELLDANGRADHQVHTGDAVTIRLHYRLDEPLPTRLRHRAAHRRGRSRHRAEHAEAGLVPDELRRARPRRPRHRPR